MKATILHDDSLPKIEPVIKEPEMKKPVIELPSMDEPLKSSLKIKPVNNDKRDIIIMIVLLVIVVGGFILLNYINSKKASENESI